MTSASFQMVGSRELAERLARLPDQVAGDKLRAAVMSAGELVANTAKEKAPVLTGNLRRSIHVEAGRVERAYAEVTVGTDVEYGPPVEFGTRYQQAQPFLRPAFDQERESALREMKVSLWDLLRGQL